MLLPSRVQDFINQSTIETPYLVVDLDIVSYNFNRLKRAMPRARHYYAIKANPDHNVLKTLAYLGGYFEVASVNEIDFCLNAGVSPEHILYGNPLKKEREIAEAYKRGIREYVFDEYSELEKISRAAPGSRVLCRIIADGKGAVSPLTIKFGAFSHQAEDWLKKAPALGLIPYGVSFHTGSQQLMPESWEKPIQDSAKIFASLEEAGHTLKVVDVGGGFPVSYRKEVPNISVFAKAILKFTKKYFKSPPLLYTEPGRYMTGDAGFIASEVVQVSQDYQDPDLRWVYLDIGRYGGLVEEKIDYPIISDKKGKPGPVILSGQTCDSNDVIYRECFNYHLPSDITDGDRVIMAYTGAYTTTYSTTLNGFASLKSYCLPLSKKGKKSTLDNLIYPDNFLNQPHVSILERDLLPKSTDIEKIETSECGLGIRSLRDFKRGELIGSFAGTLTPELLQHSLQVQPGMNIVDPFFVGFLQHDCDPNCALDMKNQRAYALKDIKAGDFISMDYATTEDRLFNQFMCSCDAPNCRLWITGRAEQINDHGLSLLNGVQNTPARRGTKAIR